MGRSRAEDPKLSEVKAVLQGLQHLSAEPDPAGQASAAEDVDHPARALPPRSTIVAVAITAALALILVGTLAFFSFRQPAGTTARIPADPARKGKTTLAPSAAVAPQSSSPAAPATAGPPSRSTAQSVLQAALGHMTSGRVQAARRELLGIASDGSADVAWALARSYDPNFLKTLPAADAAPNIVEATRWYRKWYAIAVEQGLVADSVSIERIIRSMR